MGAYRRAGSAVSSRLIAVVVSILAVGPSAIANAASPVIFSRPIAIASNGIDPSGPGSPYPGAEVAIGDRGDATVAWPGARHVSGDRPTGQEGVFVSERSSLRAPFSAPHRLATDNAFSLVLARNARGDEAIGWAATDAAGRLGPLRISVKPAGGDFGPPEDVQVPPRDPSTGAGGGSGALSIAVRHDGAVLVTYAGYDPRVGHLRAFAVVRLPTGAWTAAQVLGEYAAEETSAAADGVGGLHAVWPAAAPGHSYEDGKLVYAADAGPDGLFGAPQVISSPGTDATNAHSQIHLYANRRGDLLAIWDFGPIGGPPMVYGRVDSAYRPVSGDWQVPERAGDSFGPLAAINDSGAAIVAGSIGLGVGAAFRPPNGHFGQPQMAGQDTGGPVGRTPVALAADGTAVAVEAVHKNGHGYAIVPVVFSPGAAGAVASGPMSRQPVSEPTIATNGTGDGVVAWTAGPRGQPAVVYVASYQPALPAVAAFSVAPGAFRLRVSRPAQARVMVSGPAGRAQMTAPVHAGTNRIAFTNPVKTLLNHHGRFTATIRLRAHGQQSRPRTFQFRR